MDRLEIVQARIHSIGQLLDVVGAMRSMAAARLQQALAALAGARAYAAITDAAMADALLLADRPADPVPSGPVGVLVFTAEHGFVGAFSEALMEDALRIRPDFLAVVGSRGALTIEESGRTADWTVPMTGRIDGVPALARRLAERLFPLFAARKIARLDIIHGQTGEAGRWRTVKRTLLPLDPTRLPQARRRPFPPLHTLPVATLLRDLGAQALLADLVSAATEALAAENAARMTATSAAHDNIERRLGELTVQEQVLRQDSITTEILDVIIGAETLLGKRRTEGRRKARD